MMRLRSRRRTDPAATLAKLRDVVSPHSGIVTSLARFRVADPGFRGTFGFGATLEAATTLGYASFKERRGENEEIWREGAQGRDGNRVAFDRTRAFVRAVGEALERYAACTYEPSLLHVASWREVRERALDPRDMQRPSAEEYARLPGVQPFAPDALMRWVGAWSLRDAKDVLVPAQFVWLMYNRIEREPLVLATTSTGWAVHHTLEESTHTGLREIVERDAFFLTWFHRLRVPRLDLDSVDDADARAFIERVEADGAKLRVLVTTTDLGIPAFAAIVTDEREGHPAFSLTLGAHPDARKALRQALEEAAMMRLDLALRVRMGAVSAPERMEDIRSMGDHGEYYLKRENVAPLRFLIDDADRPVVKLADIASFGSADVLAEVNGMVSRIAKAGLDTIVVDGTPDDLREAGFVATKVIVPGAIRHEYGYSVRYLDGRRLYDAPVRMGHRATPATPADINPDAHPYS